MAAVAWAYLEGTGLEDTARAAMAAGAIAYGIAYPFGVIGVILFVKLLPKMLRKDLIAEAKALETQRKSQYPTLHTAAFKVTNKNICGKSLAQLQVRAMTGAALTRSAQA